MKTVFTLSPRDLESRLIPICEMYEVGNISEIDFSVYENHIEVEIKEIEVDDDIEDRFSYTNVVCDDKKELIDYLESWFGIVIKE